MKVVRTNRSGQLLRSEKLFYGGEFSLLEKFRMKLGGSPKVIYHHGISTFDALDPEEPTEFTFSNFELFREGLILHANSNLRGACVGVKYVDVDFVKLTGYRIDQLQRGTTIVIYRGVLEIKSRGEAAAFTVLPSIYQEIKLFFGNSPLSTKFSFEESKTEPEVEDNEPAILRFLEIVDIMAGLK